MGKKKPVDITKITEEEWPKYELAKELGYFDRILKEGWGSLTAKESGRIGGLLHKRKKQGECPEEQ